jgi:hypothetical protein
MMIGKAILETMKPHLCRPILLLPVILCLLGLLGPLGPALGEKDKLFLGFRQGEDSESIPEGWELLTYPGTGENEISLLEEDERTILHVKSLGSASGVLRRLEVDLKEFPILVWRWKINRVVGMAIESQRDRNDSTARVRVIFGRGGKKEGEKPRPVSPQIEEFLKRLGIKQTVREPTGFKIDYIWGNRIARGEVLDYPRSRNHKVVIVKSGNGEVNRWIWEKRNLVEDFELLFESSPPGLSGIVILTDTDQTNEGVEAWYSSIVLMRE